MSVNRRAALKGSLTRAIRQLEDSVKNEDISDIEKYITKVEDAYSKLATCHDEVSAKLEDEQLIKEAEAYILTECDRMEAALQSADDVLMQLKAGISADVKKKD